MIKYNKRCKVCAAVKNNKRLLNEIFNSKFYLKSTGAPLTQIAQKYPDKFTYQSLKNHVRNHQFISQDKFDEVHLQKQATHASELMLKQKLESMDVFDEVMNQGMEKLQNGDMNIKVKDLISAAKLKKDFQLKEKDQQLVMMQMVYHFASGESDRSQAYDKRIIKGEAVTDYDLTPEPTDDTERRTRQASAFYQSLAGDAPAPGSN